MLFLASKKYPEEDGYFEFLRAHGGFANAFTASTSLCVGSTLERLSSWGWANYGIWK